MSTYYIIDYFYNIFFSKVSRDIIEKIILSVAIMSFFIHLFLIFLNNYQIFGTNINNELLKNPLIAIYTPFSFVLLYEVYLLVFYLPKSFTFYLSKQYEIITLIVFRRFFKDISLVNIKDLNVKQFIISDFFLDLVAGLLMFLLLYIFKKNVSGNKAIINNDANLNRFINQKKLIAIILIPLFLLMALLSFSGWYHNFSVNTSSIINLNHIFFEDFFNILIFVDVVILLLSFFYEQDFHKIIRNSGFIISTIILRLSFGVTGFLNLILILCAILTGLVVLYIHNLFEKLKE